jgi:hypothetical protein
LHHCICESDLNIFKRPTLSVGVHPHGYDSTCTQCCQQKFERVRSGISATNIEWLIAVKRMMANQYCLSIPVIAALHDYCSRHRSSPSNTLEKSKPVGLAIRLVVCELSVLDATIDS